MYLLQDYGPAVVVPGRQFQRREVVSNWERYDGLDRQIEEDENKQRGADFNALLSVTCKLKKST